ncbi:hypothetical protein UXN85_20815 [Enterobacter hormaechei]
MITGSGLSALSPVLLQNLNGEVVKLVGGATGIYFHHRGMRYTVDKLQAKSAIPEALAGGLLEFPKRGEVFTLQGCLHFQKNNSYYLLAIISRKERKAFALHLGTFRR